jgi:hypothetical protein
MSVAFVPASAAAAVPKRAFQQTDAISVPELEIVAAPLSASVLEAAFESGTETGRAGNEAETGSGADWEF